MDETVTVSPTKILLTPHDYPKSYRGTLPGTTPYANHKDYQTDPEPIAPELFLFKDGARTRLFFRASLKLSTGTFTAATFLVDSGCCSHFNICDELRLKLQGRIHKSDIGSDNITTQIGGLKADCSVNYSLAHKPANIIGLPMLLLLGLQFNHSRMVNLTYDEENVARDFSSFSNPFGYI
jgi:hypothetical protein